MVEQGLVCIDGVFIDVLGRWVDEKVNSTLLVGISLTSFRIGTRGRGTKGNWRFLVGSAEIVK